MSGMGNETGRVVDAQASIVARMARRKREPVVTERILLQIVLAPGRREAAMVTCAHWQKDERKRMMSGRETVAAD